MKRLDSRPSTKTTEDFNKFGKSKSPNPSTVNNAANETKDAITGRII
jgi:hypothetical protein